MLLSSLKCLENEGSSKLADVRISIIKKKTYFIIGILICKQGSKLTFSFGSQLATNGKILVARS